MHLIPTRPREMDSTNVPFYRREHLSPEALKGFPDQPARIGLIFWIQDSQNHRGHSRAPRAHLLLPTLLPSAPARALGETVPLFFSPLLFLLPVPVGWHISGMRELERRILFRGVTWLSRTPGDQGGGAGGTPGVQGKRLRPPAVALQGQMPSRRPVPGTSLC